MQDIPKLYTAFAEWFSCLVVIAAGRNSGYNHKKIKEYIGVVLTLFLMAAVQLWCGTVSNWKWLIGMAVALCFMTVLLKYGRETGWRIASYRCTRAFMRAELVAALEWQIYSFYFQKDTDKIYSIESIVFCFLLYGVCFLLFYYIDTRWQKEGAYGENIEVTRKNLVMVWMLTLLMFGLSNLSYTQVSTPFTGMRETEIFNIRTLIDFAGVLAIEIFQILKIDSDRKQEMTAIQNVLRTQYLQYRESQENIDTLNRKYHDLKHQIQIIREEADEEKREQYLEEIERGISRYDAQIKTGNSILDTIFTSKSAQCQKFNIKLTVVADGNLLKRMHVMDVCTIFGNALDNAIEYEAQIKDEEKRMIHVSVSARQNFVCILVENYYEGENLKAGILPSTTKADKRYHGYGLKSIRYSVQKYQGFLNVNVKDNWFRLELLLPYKVFETQ